MNAMNRNYWIQWTALLPVIFLVSCSSVLKKEFYISAIDTDEKEVTCVIFQEDQMLLDNTTNEPIRTPGNIIVEFKEKPGGGYESVKLGVRGVVVEEGKITRGIREGEEYPYLEDTNSWRSVYANDAKRQLFILRKNKNFGG